MGPRTYIRGKLELAHQDQPHASRFNGAADLHPRKAHRSATGEASQEKCFNGAADLHPRKEDQSGEFAPISSGFNGAADLHPRKVRRFTRNIS